MKRINFLSTALLLALTATQLSWADGQKSVPLPDDDPTHAAAAPEKGARAPAPAASPTSNSGSAPSSSQTDWKEAAKVSGVKVEFRVIPSLKDVVVKRGPIPVNLNEMNEIEMVEGQQAIAQFRFTDATGSPMTGLRVAAWMDQALDKLADAGSCHNKIQSFLQMQLSARPEVDLNNYYVLSLTEEPSILVIDPRVGFSSSKLYAVIDLAGPGKDWAITGNNDRLFVSMPSAKQVAVIDTMTFKVVANVEAGTNPTRLALQQDGKYLWAANDSSDADSGVSVIDTATLRLVAHIPTGKGHHQIAFDTARNVYVTNQEEGTVSIINAEKLAKIEDVPAGNSPVAIAYSAQARAVYIASQKDGKVTAVSADDHIAVATMSAQPGLTTVQITPDGRWGFVANGTANTVLLFDVAANKFKQTYSVGGSPDQVSFSTSYAYVRSRNSEEVSMIPLADIGKDGNTAHFVAGQSVPGGKADIPANAIATSLDGSAAFVANPSDRRIYYYEEGMAAPMFSLDGYGKTPKSAMVLDRSIHETRPGIYSIGLTLPKAGKYDVPLFVDSPSLSHCFDLDVKVNPLLKKKAQVAVVLHPLKSNLQVRAGEPVQVAFRLTDPGTDKPKDDLKDVQVTVLLAEGLRQQHFIADGTGDGVYQFTFTAPKDGVYYTTVSVPSLKVKANQLPYMMIRAAQQQAAEAKTPKTE